MSESTKDGGRVSADDSDRYGWRIETDHLDGTDAGLEGPRDIEESISAALKRGQGRAFRMRDDDGELYYSGRIIGGEGFEPLDDYGGPGAGCTTIEYHVNGRWTTL